MVISGLTGYVGIGTTSPYSPLSVNGTTTALLFQATSTTATSTFPLLSANALSVNGVYANSLWSTTSDTYAFNALLAATTTLNNITTLGSLSLPLTQTTGTLSVARGGTGQTAFDQGWLASDGTTITSSTSPTVAYITATSTATSTFGGSIALYGASNPAGNIFFSAANPFIKASSYITIPGGAFFSSGTTYFANSLKARGGIANDTGQVLSITGGLGGFTAFTGNTGVGTSTGTSVVVRLVKRETIAV
jgi:hypothetical protein